MHGDVLNSRRGYNKKCMWWTINEGDPDDSQLIMSRQPVGIFWAKEYTPETKSNNTLAGVFLYSKSTVTIRTSAILKDMRENCLVKYKNKPWIVESVQYLPFRKGSGEYSEDDSTMFTYIKMRAY